MPDPRPITHAWANALTLSLQTQHQSVTNQEDPRYSDFHSSSLPQSPPFLVQHLPLSTWKYSSQKLPDGLPPFTARSVHKIGRYINTAIQGKGNLHPPRRVYVAGIAEARK